MTDAAPSAQPSVDVISSVSLVLRDLILRGIGEQFGLSPQDVRFSSPGDDKPRGTNGLSLFLYRLQPTRALSNVPARWVEPETPGPRGLQVQRLAPPLPIELCYMAVPYSEDALIELQLVGSLARLFYSLGVVDVDGLPESRARTDLLASGSPRFKLVAQYPEMEAIQSIWSSLRVPDAFKLALYYLVTPIFLPSQKVDPVYRVRELIAEIDARLR